ncbi:hypothetical protein TNCV_3384241 [Trichonephila clavipes]|uniref:Uncharacterized protein n=1 Tax=Trichonephila clavipes TaxID=2585209 RepID=A0A8X6T0Z8_TRICX|nr:hypothetical protein TNCV_3384241 [Trichonephila clavipes]
MFTRDITGAAVVQCSWSRVRSQRVMSLSPNAIEDPPKQRASSPHTLPIYCHHRKNEEFWKAMGNSGHCRANPEAPVESRGCCPLSPNYRT